MGKPQTPKQKIITILKPKRKEPKEKNKDSFNSCKRIFKTSFKNYNSFQELYKRELINIKFSLQMGDKPPGVKTRDSYHGTVESHQDKTPVGEEFFTVVSDFHPLKKRDPATFQIIPKQHSHPTPMNFNILAPMTFSHCNTASAST